MPACRSLLTAAFFATALVLAGCNDTTQAVQGVGSVQQAVEQEYDAESVDVNFRLLDGKQRLDVVLKNPGGQEATNRAAARSVAGTALAQYDGGNSLNAVRVGFEYSSEAGPAEVGFHRRYTFSPGELGGAADTSSAAAPADTAAGADTSSAPQP